jgi:acetolactate synthase-1/2/3 large subunit
MFGIPGGGSSLDIIDAGHRAGIDFVLARTETAAAFMAAVTAELTGTPGVVLTGIGPGAASAVNGISYAALEKAPVVVISDCRDADTSLHQALDQLALYRPLVKAGWRLTPDNAGQLDALLDLALTRPYGPVHVDLAARDAARPVTMAAPATRHSGPGWTDDPSHAGDLLARSTKPVILAGLDARSNDGARSLRRLADGLAAPVLCTYKAKGVFPDDDPRMIGMFTGARAEAAAVGEADLIILFGLDPVELIPGPWRYTAPVMELATTPGHRQPVPPTVTLCGPFGKVVAALEPALRKSAWTPEHIASLKQRMAEAASLSGKGITAETATRAVQRAAPAGTRLTVDAGAHMFAAMALWRAAAPYAVLKSNGLSSMGFALPAAIASALEQPLVPVVALTGDGGMMMSLGELATARQAGGKIVCVVLNDAALSLIDIKQQRAQRPAIGVRYPRSDFAAVAEGLGCRGWRVGSDDDLDLALAGAFACAGPAVVDVTIDPSGYGAQLEALRG